MNNVIRLSFARDSQPATAPEPFAGLIRSFAVHRQPRDDVYWLKENAELLGMLTSTGATCSEEALSPYAAFYNAAPAYMEFFPQYYRFILSICLDLEDLGVVGEHGMALCDKVAGGTMVCGELSDLQRAEAARLIARRGPIQHDAALRERLLGFAGAQSVFAVPNPKAAYELTHIVFYLSEYGQRDPELGPEVIANLDDLGLLAFLDRDHDLLAEVCLALRYAGKAPASVWEADVAEAHGAVTCLPMTSAGPDDYHAWLVSGWLLRERGGVAFEQTVAGGALTVRGRSTSPSVLGQMSRMLYHLGGARRSDWAVMRHRMLPELTSEGLELLQRAERSSDRFEEFFARFARVPHAA